MDSVRTGSEDLRGPVAGPALPRKGRRYPFLLQQRLRDMLLWPALLIALLTVLLFVLSPLGIEAHRPYLAAAGIGAWSVAAFTLWFSLQAFARCHSAGLWLHLPFYKVFIPYQDIQSTRLVQLGRQFPPDNETWSRRRFLEPLFFRAVVVVELRALPAPRRQLRLWMSRYLLSPDTPGFMLPVRDWLGFRGELDEFRSRSYPPTQHKER